MIAFTCPSCKKALNVKDELAGKRGACPHCKKPVNVPAGVQFKRKTDMPQPAAVQTSAGPPG